MAIDLIYSFLTYPCMTNQAQPNDLLMLRIINDNSKQQRNSFRSRVHQKDDSAEQQ